MNNVVEEKKFITKIIDAGKKNYKICSAILISFLIIFIVYQYYLYNNDKHIMDTSIIYSNIQSNILEGEINTDLKRLSKEKNFYGVLSKLEISKKNLELNNIELAFEDYISLLNKKDLKNYFQSTIAIHGSYSLLNKINLNEESSNIIDKIYILLSFVDADLVSYEGFKHEIEYLLLTFDQDIKKISKDNAKINKLYNRIQENVNISPLIKARIKKIHEFQKYN